MCGGLTIPRQLMAYLGLVPSENSTGERVWRGEITKAGNSRARRVLIEGAWTYRFPARMSRLMQERQDDLTKAVREIAWKAQLRLCSRYRKLIAAENSNRRHRNRTGNVSVPLGYRASGRAYPSPDRSRKPTFIAFNRRTNTNADIIVAHSWRQGPGGEPSRMLCGRQASTPAARSEAAPDEHTEMRYPTRASEPANRRLEALPPVLCSSYTLFFSALRSGKAEL